MAPPAIDPFPRQRVPRAGKSRQRRPIENQTHRLARRAPHTTSNQEVTRGAALQVQRAACELPVHLGALAPSLHRQSRRPRPSCALHALSIDTTPRRRATATGWCAQHVQRTLVGRLFTSDTQRLSRPPISSAARALIKPSPTATSSTTYALCALSVETEPRRHAACAGVCNMHQEAARGAALLVQQAAAMLPVHVGRISCEHASAVMLIVTSPRAQRAVRPSYATTPCRWRRGVHTKPGGHSRSGSPPPTSSRHAACPSRAHLAPSTFNSHADRYERACLARSAHAAAPPRQPGGDGARITYSEHARRAALLV